jgi:hypothetical protein
MILSFLNGLLRGYAVELCLFFMIIEGTEYLKTTDMVHLVSPIRTEACILFQESLHQGKCPKMNYSI